MAHRIYQGKTGVVWNVTKSAVGILLKKKVGNRYRTKRIHVRIEHVNHSGCKESQERSEKISKKGFEEDTKGTGPCVFG